MAQNLMSAKMASGYRSQFAIVRARQLPDATVIQAYEVRRNPPGCRKPHFGQLTV